MGSILSLFYRPSIQRIFEEDNNISGQGRDAILQFTILGLNEKNIQDLFEIFVDIDKDENDFIDRDEFYYWLKLPRTDFIDRVFTILDSSRTGEINFKEFVTCVYNYCSFDYRALTKFAFNLLDLEERRFLEKNDIRRLIYMLYGNASEEAKDERLDQIMNLIDSNKDDNISFEEFQEFSKRFPAMMLPGCGSLFFSLFIYFLYSSLSPFTCLAFQMQQILRERILGIAFWNKEMLKKQDKESGGGGRKENIYEMLIEIEDPRFKRKIIEYKELEQTKSGGNKRSVENREKVSLREEVLSFFL